MRQGDSDIDARPLIRLTGQQETTTQQGDALLQADQSLVRAILSRTIRRRRYTNTIINYAHMEHLFIRKQKNIDIGRMSMLPYVCHCFMDAIIEMGGINKGQVR